MKVYAYNPERLTGYVYRFTPKGSIYERALQPFGGWDRESKMGDGFTKEDIITSLVEEGYLVGLDKTVVLEHCKWELKD